jgi:DNA repair protein RecN (Recombination protein N)
MLEELHVRDLALIEEAWLEFGTGLNVLSGETGAGKTVLIEALQLLVGERADSSLVRSGADEALVEGRFEVGSRERTARRRVSAQGRSRAYLDDGMASVGELAEELGPLVDLHGQHDHQALLRPGVHAGLLARFGGEQVASARARYEGAFAAAQEAQRRLDDVRDSRAERQARREALESVRDDIDAVAPEPDEDAALEGLLPRLRHAERLAEAAAAAYRALRDEGGAVDATAGAAKALGASRDVDPTLDDMREEIEGSLAVLEDVASRLRDYGEGLEHDPGELDRTQARLAALDALKRRHGPTLADILVAREAAIDALEELDGDTERLSALAEAARVAEASLAQAGSDLAGALRAVVAPFEGALGQAAEDLAMGAGRFGVEVEDLPRERWSQGWPARVEFLFSSSAGDAPKSLVKVASGGEVSRVMLALKSVLGQADSTPVLVFDEIDAGIGGATAVAVGRRLANLARDRQVIVVTHLAQVAAFADRHLVVRKDECDERAVTSVEAVEGDARVAELARMLSGSDSDAGLAHARELLAAVGTGA